MKKKKSGEEGNKTGAVGIGIGSGIIASICCLGPAFIVLLGLSGLSAALSLTQFQPYFIALSIVFMAGAIWVYLRRKNQGHCDMHVVQKNKRFIAVVALTMVIFYVMTLYVVMPLVTPHIYGTFGDNTNPKPPQKLRQVTLSIQGMTCPSCADAVESLLKQNEGIVSASVNYYQGTGIVVYEPSKITTEEIVKAIQPYTATITENKELG